MRTILPSSLSFGVNSKRLALRSETTKGFTLIELLVVISIIAILSVIGVTLFGNVQKNARDAQRRGDVEAISKAFETNATSGTATPYAIPQTSWFASGNFPKDPQGGEYFWNGAQSIPTAAKATYTICAKLESLTGNSSSAGDGSTFTAAAGNGTYFCRKNLQ